MSYSRKQFIKNTILGSAGILTNPKLPEFNFEADARIVFPNDFIFGASTSAYQIEGAWKADGKGESIWDRFSNGHDKVSISGNRACDHYDLMEKDVDLMKKMGLRGYRFSVSWTRIFPDGKGHPNVKGIDFYKKLVDQLVQNDITPMLTIYHWDLPQKLQDIGGWASRDTAYYFRDYASYLFQKLGDKVPFWITHNEPWVTAYIGYAFGKYAPGIKDFSTALSVTHNLLLSHGLAVQAYRKANIKGKIGITLDLQYSYPKSDTSEDKKAAEINNRQHLNWFADPIFLGKYPDDIWQLYVNHKLKMPDVRVGDMSIIHKKVDFLGLNYYYPTYATVGDWWPFGISVKTSVDSRNFALPAQNPKGLLDFMRRCNRDYNGVELIVTENGVSLLDDRPDWNNKIIDNARIYSLYNHIAICKQALNEGIKLKGYYTWSLMDNYGWGEWNRMGLIYVDFKTLRRTIKKSGYWYGDCTRNGFYLPRS